MAPNRRGSAPQSDSGGVINSAEVEARGRGTKDDGDTYDASRRSGSLVHQVPSLLWSEYRVFFTGEVCICSLITAAYLAPLPASRGPKDGTGIDRLDVPDSSALS
eukprot:1156508-Pelagomonas_calceolata.AAC.1